jgi:formamidopyrimidine-DNA glycosylase
VGFEARRHDVLREATAEVFARDLTGGTVLRVWRRAKLVVLDIGSGLHAESHVAVQPRFTGGLIVDDGTLDEREREYVAATIRLADGRSVHYRDVRRLGTVALMSPARWSEYEGMLGIEPLDPRLGDAEFSALLRSSRLAVKSLLMDQRRIVGIGNIYANEALWRSRIDPSREARSLSGEEAASLRSELRATLLASIDARGTSFRDYRDARGERGGFVEQLAAYGRAGEPCTRCGRRLVGTHAIDGRSTVFCASCQR